MVIIVDANGFSSYTLAQYINEIGLTADVYSYKAVTPELVDDLKPSHMMLSFGDYQESAFKNAAILINTFIPQIPILGIGIGFHAILAALHPQLAYSKSATQCDTGIYNKAFSTCVDPSISIGNEASGGEREGVYKQYMTERDNPRTTKLPIERRRVYHRGVGIFAGAPSPFQTILWPVMTVSDAELPNVVDITAWTQDDKGELGMVVGIRHQDWPLEAVLCDPCSVLTQHGLALIKHFLK